VNHILCRPDASRSLNSSDCNYIVYWPGITCNLYRPNYIYLLHWIRKLCSILPTYQLQSNGQVITTFYIGHVVATLCTGQLVATHYTVEVVGVLYIGWAAAIHVISLHWHGAATLHVGQVVQPTLTSCSCYLQHDKPQAIRLVSVAKLEPIISRSATAQFCRFSHCGLPSHLSTTQ
jgi:hypothetical protein